MKNLILHYLALIIVPNLIFFGRRELWITIPSTLFFTLYFAWCLLFIPFMTGRRMYLKGMIPKIKLVYDLSWKQFKEIYFSK